jgi:hypothetical protein
VPAPRPSEPLDQGGDEIVYRAAVQYAEPDDVRGVNARQGALPGEIARRIEAAPAEIEVEVGHIRVRTQGLGADIAIQEGDRLTTISVDPKQ